MWEIFDCLICGELGHRCKDHSNMNNLQNRFGLCESCTNDLQFLCGERKARDGDESIQLSRADQHKAMRVMQYLIKLEQEV